MSLRILRAVLPPRKTASISKEKIPCIGRRCRNSRRHRINLFLCDCCTRREGNALLFRTIIKVEAIGRIGAVQFKGQRDILGRSTKQRICRLRIGLASSLLRVCRFLLRVRSSGICDVLTGRRCSGGLRGSGLRFRIIHSPGRCIRVGFRNRRSYLCGLRGCCFRFRRRGIFSRISDYVERQQCHRQHGWHPFHPFCSFHSEPSLCFSPLTAVSPNRNKASAEFQSDVFFLQSKSCRRYTLPPCTEVFARSLRRTSQAQSDVHCRLANHPRNLAIYNLAL